jgi:hypothetical protein
MVEPSFVQNLLVAGVHPKYLEPIASKDDYLLVFHLSVSRSRSTMLMLNLPKAKERHSFQLME